MPGMASATEQLDRRGRRRLESIEEVLDHAVAIMAEEGVAGLSLGEIARRMGIRPPSLYVYFPSKHALYDALFARGWRLLTEAMRGQLSEPLPDGADLAAVMQRAGETFVRWAIEHAAYAQLLFWRPVPGFDPTPAAYRPAEELYQLGRSRLGELQAGKMIRADADLDATFRDWTVLVSGVISQQLSNAPDEPFERGRFTAALPSLAAMFAAHYGIPARARAPRHTTSTRRGHADPRRSDR